MQSISKKNKWSKKGHLRGVRKTLTEPGEYHYRYSNKYKDIGEIFKSTVMFKTPFIHILNTLLNVYNICIHKYEQKIIKRHNW